MDLLYFLFGFDGRFNRAKFWLAVVLYTAVSLAFAFFAIDTLRLLDKDSSFEFLGGGLVLWITGLSLALMVLWSSLATGVKRLHDRDKSGWWILLFLLAPIVLSASRPHRDPRRRRRAADAREFRHRGLGPHRTRLPARHARC